MNNRLSNPNCDKSWQEEIKQKTEEHDYKAANDLAAAFPVEIRAYVN